MIIRSAAARHARRPARVLALGLAALLAMPDAPAAATVATAAAFAKRSPIEAAVSEDRELAAFYRANDYRPLWIAGDALRPEAAMLLARLRAAADDGLAPERYGIDKLEAAIAAAQGGSDTALARAERLLSRAYADYLVDLHRPDPAAALIYVHEGLAPAARTPRQWLDAAAKAPSLGEAIATATRLNPLYEELRAGLAAYRSTWSALPAVRVAPGPLLKSGATGPRVAALRQRLGLSPSPARFDAALAAKLRAFQAAHGLPVDGAAGARTVAALNDGPAKYERLVRVNLERARAIPADPGRRFILVDTVGATLRAYEDGRVRDRMKVIVGKTDQPTPAMAARISYAVLNPYWNLPPDLAQVRAQRVLKQGKAYLRQDKLEALSGWDADARMLSPDEVDWKAVAAGTQKLRMRQTPGPHNMMGKIKFMMPNRLGIYLHDTPDKRLFASAERRFSSGCVRLEDWTRLADWVFDGAPPSPAAVGPETRVDLPDPVPVYITYLTVEAKPGGGLAFRPDPYRRDATLLAALAAGGGSPTAQALR
jgi:L,D-transpeptidase YcbB